MARMALPKIGNAIEHRRDRIANDLDQAQALKEATDRAIAAYEERWPRPAPMPTPLPRRRARSSRTRSMPSGRASMPSLPPRWPKAEKRIAKVKDGALDEMQKVAGDLAGDIVAQLIGAKVTGDQAAKAVEEVSER
jgi:F-type H+-transporting ATPase subunit b